MDSEGMYFMILEGKTVLEPSLVLQRPTN